MRLNRPISDTYVKSNGSLIPTNGFLKAERYILQNRGWNYNKSLRAWLPPK